MDYLTASEIAKAWNVSNRMVAYYCKAEKVTGAIKKGKTWLIPASAEKPSDNRFTKNKMVIVDNPELQGDLQKINSIDADNTSVYRANDLYKNLGLTRETLRYYEDIGLIRPQRNRNSQYREFTFDDVSRLMTIDFYKKRGFQALEIKELMDMSKQDSAKLIADKINSIEDNIRAEKRTIKRLCETKAFCEDACEADELFTIKELPPYLVLETFDAVSALGDYKERVLAFMDLQEEDILSNLVRAVTFDQTGYKGTKMCLVEQATSKKQSVKKPYLESGRCLHTVLKADSHDDSVMEKMFLKSFAWANENKKNFKGVVYIFIRFIELSEQTEQNFYEIFIPLK